MVHPIEIGVPLTCFGTWDNKALKEISRKVFVVWFDSLALPTETASLTLGVTSSTVNAWKSGRTLIPSWLTAGIIMNRLEREGLLDELVEGLRDLLIRKRSFDMGFATRDGE